MGTQAWIGEPEPLELTEAASTQNHQQIGSTDRYEEDPSKKGNTYNININQIQLDWGILSSRLKERKKKPPLYLSKERSKGSEGGEG